MTEGEHIFEAFEDIQFIVEAWPGLSDIGEAFYVDFIVRGIWVEECTDGTKRHTYVRLGANSSCDRTENVAEAEWHVKGAVKWDGCCNYSYNCGEVLLHICGPEDVEREAELLRRVYRLAHKMMSDTADFSPPKATA